MVVLWHVVLPLQLARAIKSGFCVERLLFCKFHLHAEDGEDVDDDKQDEGEVAKGAQRRDDDAQQHLEVEDGGDEEYEMCRL